jgi:hypothetical protein
MNGNKKILSACLVSLFVYANLSNATMVSASGLTIELVKIGEIETGGDAYDVWVDEELEIAYVTCGFGGLRIYNVSGPSNPVLLAHVPETAALIATGHSTGYAHQLFVQDNIVYIGDGPSGLTMIDVNDPTKPTVLTHFVGGYTWDVHVNGDIVYAVNGWNNLGTPGFMIINTSDLNNPQVLSNTQTDGDTTDLEVVGNNAYIVKNIAELRILDITNPADPTLLGQYTGPSNTYAVDVEISGNLAFLVFWKKGLMVLDITDPSNIKEKHEFIGDVEQFGFLSLNDGFAYLATPDGIVVLNVNDPNFPVVGSYKDDGQPYGVYSRGDYVFVTDQVDGLTILEIKRSSSNSSDSRIIFGMIPLWLLIVAFRRKKG